MGESRRRPPPLRAVPAEDEADDPTQAAELSRAAREAVRQPADPRIDRQLAWMGLADDEPAGAPDERLADVGAGAAAAPVAGSADEHGGEPVAPVPVETHADVDDLDELRATVARLSAAVERAEGRFRALAVVVAVEAVAIVLVAALFLTR